jgi:hypothetical protein
MYQKVSRGHQPEHAHGKIKLNDITEMGDQALVGYFPGKRMNSEELKNWTNLNFKPVVGASPCTLILVKGWLVLVFTRTKEAKRRLHQQWK